VGSKKMLDLCLIILFCVLGVLVGILTGLLPGLHVNNIALILLSLSGAIVALCSSLFNYGISEQFIFILISGFIIAVSLSHTFHDAIPTTFIGAPEEDTALSVLPAHDLLLKGQGYKAIALSALGSYGAIVICLFLLFPLRFLIGSPLFLYETLQEVMVWVLIAISILMLATETAKIDDFGTHGKTPAISGILFATFVFFLSGLFGLIILDFQLDSPIGLDAPVLFPALAGLFGTPTLINSLMTKPHIPQQKLEQLTLTKQEKHSSILSIITGSLAGILVSIIPGITSATGTILAMNAREGSGNEQTIVTLSSVNTASAFSVIVVLFIILRPRSGAALAVNELVAIEEWTAAMLPTTLLYFLIFLTLGGALSYFFTLKIGKLFARKFANVPYPLLVSLTITMIVILVFIFTGFLGVLILMSSTCIGFLPVLWGVRRSHCMGLLMIPIILHFL
jgi:putative membrane protein